MAAANVCCKQNKERFIAGLKNQFIDDKRTSVVEIDDEVVDELIELGYLKFKKLKNDYLVPASIDTNYGVAFINVCKDCYKVVDEEMADVLADIKWRYDGNSVYTYTINKGRKTLIELAVISIEKTGQIDRSYISELEDCHHAWFRFSAMAGMLRNLNPKIHKKNHRIIGNYARNQHILVRNEAEYQNLMGEIISALNILNDKVFSIEF